MTAVAVVYLMGALDWCGRPFRRAAWLTRRWLSRATAVLAERLDRIDPPCGHHAAIPQTPAPDGAPAQETPRPADPPWEGGAVRAGAATPTDAAAGSPSGAPLAATTEPPKVVAAGLPGDGAPVRPGQPATPALAAASPGGQHPYDDAPRRVRLYMDPGWLAARPVRFTSRTLAIDLEDILTTPGWDSAMVRTGRKATATTAAQAVIA